MMPLVTIIDEALPQGDFTRLRRAVIALGRERIVAGYQTTFWFDFDERPRSLVEVAALELRNQIPPRKRRHVTGVEWWLSRMRTSNVKVDFHRDRDNAAFDDDGLERHPAVSSLLYLNRCQGGLLAVTREDPNPENPAFAPDEHAFDFVKPAPNRFTFFDGSLTHGVLDAKNQIPGARLPTQRSWRLAIAINFWVEPPRRVPRFDASRHYRRLVC